MFEHAVSTGNLSYSFQTPVVRIEDANGIVTVVARDGTSYRAKSVIATVPLNVLSSIEFSPPLPQEKQAAAAEGSVNKCNKLHVDLNGPDWLSWGSLGAPGKGLIALFGDGLTAADNSHLVGFGPDPNTERGMQLDDIEAIKVAVKDLLPKDKAEEVVFNRIVSTSNILVQIYCKRANRGSSRSTMIGTQMSSPKEPGATFLQTSLRSI